MPAPGVGVQAVLYGYCYQPMPGRVEVHLVDPVAETIVGAQHREEGIGVDRPSLRLGRASQPTESGQFRDSLLRTETRDRLEQALIGAERVIVGKRRRLVEHLVSFRPHARYGRALCR